MWFVQQREIQILEDLPSGSQISTCLELQEGGWQRGGLYEFRKDLITGATGGGVVTADMRSESMQISATDCGALSIETAVKSALKAPHLDFSDLGARYKGATGAGTLQLLCLAKISHNLVGIRMCLVRGLCPGGTLQVRVDECCLQRPPHAT